MRMNYIKPTLYAILILIVLYYMRVTVVVDFIDSYKDTHNYVIDYILTFRYRQPLVFISLPFIAIWLMGKK